MLITDEKRINYIGRSDFSEKYNYIDFANHIISFNINFVLLLLNLQTFHILSVLLRGAKVTAVILNLWYKTEHYCNYSTSVI